MKLIAVHLCHNRPNDGMPSGVVPQIALCGLTLESPYWDRALKCDIGPTELFLGNRRRWHHQGYRSWVGNWCWDVVMLTPDDAADMLAFVLKRKYRPTVGTADLLDKIDRFELITGADLEAAA